MPSVNMHDAKTRLSKLVEALVSGAEKEITIARNGKPAVRMTAVTSERPKRRLGLATYRLVTRDALLAGYGDHVMIV